MLSTDRVIDSGPMGPDGLEEVTSTQIETEDSICVGCGLCCDGTLHAVATVQAHDEAAVKAAGLEISGKVGERVFRQPCPRFSCGSCSVYERRPRVCRTYRCALLINVEAGSISRSVAREKIAIAKSLVAAVNANEPESARAEKRSLYAKRLNSELNRLQPQARSEAEAALRDVAALQRFLIRWFFEGKRGFVPLQGSAIAMDGKGIVLLGESAAVASSELGDRVIDAQSFFVGFGAAGMPCVTTVLPGLESGTELSRGEDTGDELFDKFDTALGPESGARSDLPLAGIYVLAPSDDFSFERLAGVEAADAMFAFTDRRSFSSASWLHSARVAAAVPVFRASTSDSKRLLEHSSELVNAGN